MATTKIKEAFSDFLTAGAFFKALDDVSGYEAPWEDDITPLNLDMIYIGHSGNKTLSPLAKIILGTDTKYTAAERATLAGLLIDYYNNKWTRLYSALSVTYNPIENYDKSETHTGTDTSAGTAQANAGTSESSVYGFNSTSAVPTGKEENSASHSDVVTYNSTIRTHGNIGVTTTDQMLRGFVAFWQWNFFNMVFDDIDKLFALEVYE